MLLGERRVLTACPQLNFEHLTGTLTNISSEHSPHARVKVQAEFVRTKLCFMFGAQI